MVRLATIALLLCAWWGVASAMAAEPEFPALTGRVMDDANLLDNATQRSLTGLLQRHEDTTGNQVVIVTLPSLHDMSIEQFGYQLGRHWGIGQAGRNNGLLLIVAPDERKVRIEVGYGLEGDMTDAMARTIIETVIVPHFRDGDLQRGIVAGANAIVFALEGAATYEASENTGGIAGRSRIELIGTLIAVVVVVVFVLFFAIVAIEPYRRGYFRYLKHTRDQPDLHFAWYQAWFAWRTDTGYLNSDYYPETDGGHSDDDSISYGYSGGGYSDSGYSGGGFSGGGFGGGGGGFSGGGGSFGGGGASGGW